MNLKVAEVGDRDWV